MSWSVSRLGKAAAVRVALAADFAKITCPEPEQTVKNSIAAAVDAALSLYPSDKPVRVEANGSQWKPKADQPEAFNHAQLKLEGLGEFLE